MLQTAHIETPTESTAEHCLNLATRAAAEGDFRTAADIALKGSEYFPDEISLRLAAAHFLESLGLRAETKRAVEAALILLRRRASQNPLDPENHRSKAALEFRLGEIEAAWRSWGRVLALCPNDIAARIARARSGLRIAQWEDLEKIPSDGLISIASDPELTPSNLLTLPLYGLGAARFASAKHAANLADVASRNGGRFCERAISPEGKPLRIGYLSPDFNDHAVAHLLPRVFELHDRTRCTVHAYSIGGDDRSSVRARLKNAADSWVDIETLSARAAAQRIAEDRIDILVDLAGHTLGGRPEILSFRSAPIQMTWLGYPGSTGAKYIDYIITDETVMPLSERFCSESRLYLSGTYLPTDDAQPIAEKTFSRADSGLPEDATVFCAFHAPHKIEPEIFSAWLKMLRGAPKSVLWLRAKQPQFAVNLRNLAAAQGIAPERLIFDTQILPKPEYLARLALADAFLDTKHYNAHSTAIDALWAGLPVLTVSGDAWPGRVGSALVRAAGCPELAAADIADYVTKALRIASDVDYRASLKSQLRAARASAPLFRSKNFTHALEAGFHAAASRLRAGLPLADIYSANAAIPSASATP